jgi:hypothetical protein
MTGCQFHSDDEAGEPHSDGERERPNRERDREDEPGEPGDGEGPHGWGLRGGIDRRAFLKSAVAIVGTAALVSVLKT